MNERVKSLLEHMFEDVQDILSMTDNINDFDEFYKNMPIRKATVMSLLNIGELVNRLPLEYTNSHPELPWRMMVNLRNIAAHGYHNLNHLIIWEIVQDSVPELSAFLQKELDAGGV